MNAAEKIQAAIEKLEKSVGVYDISNGWLIEIDTDIITGDPRVPLTSDPLIVMLYRTIDAQLAILYEADFQMSGVTEAAGFIGKEFNLFVRLAEAILA